MTIRRAAIAALLLLLGSGGPACNIPVKTGWYTCDPAISSSCPSGQECVWSAENGEYRCVETGGTHPECGNDVAEQGEECDGQDLAGATCLSLGYAGGTLTCGVACALDESECQQSSECGNGEAESGEECDGNDLAGQSCAGLGYPGGTLACNANCSFSTMGCDPPITCGNDVVDPNEDCDGADLDSQTCELQGFTGGTLACFENCSFDVSGCYTCADLDGDGHLDYDVATCPVGDDQCATDEHNWTTTGCTSCTDGDGDGYGANCDEGPDCNDEDNTIWTGCSGCTDGDNDGHDGYDAVDCPSGDDHCDNDALNWTAAGCNNCTDNDGDGVYGTDCDLSEDCDDWAPGIVVPCQVNGCPQGWAHIPAGTFWMGCNSGELDNTCDSDEQPRHAVTLSEYCIQVTEVSVAEFRECKATSVCNNTPDSTDDRDWCNWSSTIGSREDHPINCIENGYARNYCSHWIGGDLPTEAQWEMAARGASPDQRKYPWGSTDPTNCSLCNWNYSGGGSPYGCNDVTSYQGPATWPVGSLTTSAGDSPFGLKDMAGNVFEHVRDYYQSDYYDSCAGGCTDPVNYNSASGTLVIRGGAFSSLTDWLRVVNRGGRLPSEKNSEVGFRCVRTVP